MNAACYIERKFLKHEELCMNETDQICIGTVTKNEELCMNETDQICITH
mgnify:CR=1 FL=1